MIILMAVGLYFLALLGISRLAVRRSLGNETFFRANRRSPWAMVAFGMIGASISGITFVSVPGMVLSSGMTYLQLCIGFILGYLAVAFVLLPVYYRLNLTSIYAYLGLRLGRSSYLSGAWFFLLSKLSGSAVKFYVVCIILHQFVFQAYGVPFPLTAALLVLLIWLYTRRGGIATLVFTDTFQTLCLFSALLLILYKVTEAMDFHHLSEAARAIATDSRCRVFEFGDWASPHNFWKQLISGAFIVVVMTGLDQDIMQKNLTCRTLREAQKDMCTYGVAFLPANLLFLALGVLLAQLFEMQGTALPAKGDELLPMFVDQSGLLVCIPFVIGIVAASFSSADSALTSLTTCFCVDICQRPDNERLRRRTHLAMCLLFVLFIIIFHAANSTNLIDAIYTMVSYTYGPLLGLFAFGLFTKRQVRSRIVPLVVVASPLLCYGIERLAGQYLSYHFGYELLLLNGGLTFMGLMIFQEKTT